MRVTRALGEPAGGGKPERVGGIHRRRVGTYGNLAESLKPLSPSRMSTDTLRASSHRRCRLPPGDPAAVTPALSPRGSFPSRPSVPGLGPLTQSPPGGGCC